LAGRAAVFPELVSCGGVGTGARPGNCAAAAVAVARARSRTRARGLSARALAVRLERPLAPRPGSTNPGKPGVGASGVRVFPGFWPGAPPFFLSWCRAAAGAPQFVSCGGTRTDPRPGNCAAAAVAVARARSRTRARQLSARALAVRLEPPLAPRRDSTNSGKPGVGASGVRVFSGFWPGAQPFFL